MSILHHYLLALGACCILSLLSTSGILAQSGCMDSSACNYDAEAVEDDGSCTFHLWFKMIGSYTTPLEFTLHSNLVEGPESTLILESNMFQGDSVVFCFAPGCYEVFWDDDQLFEDFHLGTQEHYSHFAASHFYGNYMRVALGRPICIEGCVDSEACDYSPWANIAGPCEYSDCTGCTDPEACNFMPNAPIDTSEGTCVYLSDYPSTCENAVDISCYPWKHFSPGNCAAELETGEVWAQWDSSPECGIACAAYFESAPQVNYTIYKGGCEDLVPVYEHTAPHAQTAPESMFFWGLFYYAEPIPYHVKYTPVHEQVANGQVQLDCITLPLTFPNIAEVGWPNACDTLSLNFGIIDGPDEDVKFHPLHQGVLITVFGQNFDAQLTLSTLDGQELAYVDDCLISGCDEVLELPELEANETYLLNVEPWNGVWQPDHQFDVCIHYLNCLPGDLTCDGQFNTEDILEFLIEFGQYGDLESDFNNDGVVDVDDLIFFLSLISGG